MGLFDEKCPHCTDGQGLLTSCSSCGGTGKSSAGDLNIGKPLPPLGSGPNWKEPLK